MIYISHVYGGPELRGSKIDRAIAKVTRLRGEGHEGPSGSVDVVFHVPGSIASPEHLGIRTGRFSKKQRMLMLQVAVPREVLDQDDADIEAFIIDSLREAARIATPVFAGAQVPYDEQDHLSVVDGIQTALMH